MIKAQIQKVVGGKDLLRGEMEEAMKYIMGGEATPAQIGSFITALRMKGETVEEITGAAKIMREKATKISPKLSDGDILIDTCGTGGDGSNTFNISTVSALVAAGAGARVAKHGNRAVSSLCGSADVLGALGVNIDISPSHVEKCIEEVGIGFLFAPLLHGAMKHAIGPRREMGIRTIFNVLGPLTNPAGAKAQLLGVYDPMLLEVIARVLRALGSIRAMVVNGDGTDEITTTGKTRVSYLHDGEIENFDIFPEDFGFIRASNDDLKGGDPEKSAQMIEGLLKGETGARRDVVLLNSAASIMMAGLVTDLKSGIEMAADSIDTGFAMKKLDELKEFTSNVA